MSEQISEERVYFWRTFSLMLQSGVPILETLEIAANEADEELKNIGSELRNSVASGKAISDVMRENSEMFSAFETTMVEAGEIGGDVGSIAAEIAAVMKMPRGRARFWRSFGLMVQNGLPILAVLEIAPQEADRKLKSIATRIREGIQGGKAISDVMEKHPETFSAFETAMVRAGEGGGNLDAVAERIGKLLSESAAV